MASATIPPKLFANIKRFVGKCKTKVYLFCVIGKVSVFLYPSKNEGGMKYVYEIEQRTFHFREPAGTSRGVYRTRRSWLVRLTDEEGRMGVGECAPLPQLSCDDLPDYEKMLADACEVVARSGRTDFDELRPFPSMVFGLETAVLHAQRGSLALFNTPFSRGEEGIPINGLVWMGNYDEMLQRMEEKLRQGFRCVKIKIGAIGWDEEMALLRLIRSRFSRQDVELRVDANGAFSVDEAPKKLEELARFDVHSIEQPVRAGQWEALARLCREAPVPIALDEELIGANRLREKQELLDAVQPQYIVLKPSLHGGIRGTQEWISEAEKRGIGSWITSALESNVGLNAVAQLAARVYGPDIQFPQGLGTGQLFVDNIPLPLEIRGDELWVVEGSPTLTLP